MSELKVRAKHRAILRVDSEGRVAAANDGALRLLGSHCLGRSCDEVVRGRTSDGASLCRSGCARELASGLAAERGIVRARLREDSATTLIECSRVGSEVHVLIERQLGADSTERLTVRERRVLSLVSQGLSSSEIARKLGIGAATVRTHVEHARGRLGASTRAQAVLRAFLTDQLDDEL